MAPMQDNSPVANGSTRQPSKGQKWKFIFLDPTFGGECPRIPHMQKRNSIVCSASPIFAEMPAEVQEMLLGLESKGESAPVAGSGKKAVDHLRRLSQDSGSGLSGSGFGDDSDDDDKKSDSGSGFSDMTDEDKKERKVSKNASAKLSKKSDSGSGLGEGSDTSCSKDKSLTDDAVEPPAAPLRNNRRADTVIEKPEKTRQNSMSSDEDLLSNPFASDSDEEKGSGLDSARSSAKSEKEISTKVASARPSAKSEADISTKVAA